MKTKKQIVNQQIKLQEDLQSRGFNIVICGNCGAVLIHKTNTHKINCFCGITMSLSDCSDLYYSGIEFSEK